MPTRPPAHSCARLDVLEAHLAGGDEPAAAIGDAGLPELLGAALVDGRGSHVDPTECLPAGIGFAHSLARFDAAVTTKRSRLGMDAGQPADDTCDRRVTATAGINGVDGRSGHSVSIVHPDFGPTLFG